MTFCQLSVRPEDLPLPSVNFLCGQKTFCYFSVWLWRPFVNLHQLSCSWETLRSLRQLSVLPEDFGSTFRASGITSENFRQLSVRQGDRPPTSLNLENCQNLTELSRLYKNLQRDLQQHGKLLEVYGGSPGCTEISQNLQESLPVTLKVDGN